MIRQKKVHIELSGGLGNQLFSLFLGLYIAKLSKRELVISKSLLGMGYGHVDNSLELVKIDGIHIKALMTESKLTSFIRKQLVRLTWRLKKLSKLEEIILNVQNFDGVNAALKNSKRNFVTLRTQSIGSNEFIDPITKLNYEISLCEELLPKEYESLLSDVIKLRPLIIHIRGGDYKKLSQSYGLLSDEYFRKSIQIALEILGKKTPIWVFTDDENYTKSLLKKLSFNFRILGPRPGLKAIHFLLIMSHGAGHIICNSTFSWWAATLSTSTKCVLYPNPWYRNLELSFPKVSDYWIGVDSTWRNQDDPINN